ncbi:unnamed protein product [Ixodes pacificus]
MTMIAFFLFVAVLTVSASEMQRQRLCVDKGRNETVAYAKVVEFENFCIYYCVARGNDGWAYGYYHDWTECKGGFCKNGWCNRPRLCKT